MTAPAEQGRARRVAVAVLSLLFGIGLAWFTQRHIEARRPRPDRVEVKGPAQTLTGSGEVVAEGSGFVEGQVVFPDGRPAAGARVTATVLQNGAAPRVTTDGEGRFRVVVRGAGTVVLQAERDGYGPGFDTALLNQPEPVRLTLQGGSVVRGVVLRDGAPAAGIFVHAGQAGMFPQQQSLTDAAGRFAIGGLRPGSVELIATDEAAGTGFETVLVPEVAEGSSQEVEATLELLPAPSIPVVIVDMVTSQPVEGAIVTVSRDVMHVLALSAGVEQGATTIRYLPDAERFALSVRAPGYLPWQQEVTVTPDLQLRVELSRGGTITGRVVNGAGVAVEGAAVFALVRDKAGSVWEVRKSSFDSIHPLVRPEGTFFWVPTIDFVSRADGSFILTGLPEGEAVAVAEKPAMAAAVSRLLQLRAALPTEGVTLTLQPGRRVRGRVENEAGGAIEGASILIKNQGLPPWWMPAPMVTAADGLFEINGATAVVDVSVTHPDFQPLKTRLEVAERGLDDQRLVLTQGTGKGVRGRLFLPRGKPAVGASVWFTRSGGEQPVCAAEVREDGWFETEPCRGEPDRLLAVHPEATPLSLAVTDTASERDYRFGRGGELEMAAEGAPVTISLALKPPFPAALYALPTASVAPWKRTRFSGLPPGEYEVTCRTEGRAPARLTLQLAADARVEQTCPAAKSEREGAVMVVDPQGSPVAGAFVRRAGAVAGPWVATDARGQALLSGTDDEAVAIEASHVAWGRGSASLTLGRDAKPARLVLGGPVCGDDTKAMRGRFAGVGLDLFCDGRAAQVAALGKGSAAAGRGLQERDRILWLDGAGTSTLRVTVMRGGRALLVSIPSTPP